MKKLTEAPIHTSSLVSEPRHHSPAHAHTPRPAAASAAAVAGPGRPPAAHAPPHRPRPPAAARQAYSAISSQYGSAYMAMAAAPRPSPASSDCAQPTARPAPVHSASEGASRSRTDANHAAYARSAPGAAAALKPNAAERVSSPGCCRCATYPSPPVTPQPSSAAALPLFWALSAPSSAVVPRAVGAAPRGGAAGRCAAGLAVAAAGGRALAARRGGAAAAFAGCGEGGGMGASSDSGWRCSGAGVGPGPGSAPAAPRAAAGRPRGCGDAAREPRAGGTAPRQPSSDTSGRLAAACSGGPPRDPPSPRPSRGGSWTAGADCGGACLPAASHGPAACAPVCIVGSERRSPWKNCQAASNSAWMKSASWLLARGAPCAGRRRRPCCATGSAAAAAAGAAHGGGACSGLGAAVAVTNDASLSSRLPTAGEPAHASRPASAASPPMGSEGSPPAGRTELAPAACATAAAAGTDGSLPLARPP